VQAAARAHAQLWSWSSDADREALGHNFRRFVVIFCISSVRNHDAILLLELDNRASSDHAVLGSGVAHFRGEGKI